MKELLSVYHRRLWPLFYSIVLVILYTSLHSFECIFPANLCVSTDVLNNRFSSICGLLEALLVLFSLNNNFLSHKGHNIISHFINEIRRPTKVSGNISFTISPGEYKIEGGSIDMVHIKNASTVEELRDHIYEEFKRVKKSLREEVKRVNDKVIENNKIYAERISELDNVNKKHMSLIQDLAIGNSNSQIFGVFLVIFSAVINAL